MPDMYSFPQLPVNFIVAHRDSQTSLQTVGEL